MKYNIFVDDTLVFQTSSFGAYLDNQVTITTAFKALGFIPVIRTRLVQTHEFLATLCYISIKANII